MGPNGEGRKIHWVSWAKMSEAKDLGGLGFKDMECLNKVLVEKQGWHILTQSESLLARVLSIFHIAPSSKPSKVVELFGVGKTSFGVGNGLKEVTDDMLGVELLFFVGTTDGFLRFFQALLSPRRTMIIVSYGLLNCYTYREGLRISKCYNIILIKI